MNTKTFSLILAFLTLNLVAWSQKKSSENYTDYKVNLLFGLNQPLVGGFNIEGNFFTKHLAFDYSHGVSLNFDNEFLDTDNKEQNLDIHLPWTTGFGVGFRFNDWLNLRVEPKWHRYELFYKDEEQISSNRILAYNTFTLGMGLYANLQPFKKQDNFLKGIMVAPSVRFWPNVSTTLDDDKAEYYNKTTEHVETHEAMNVGISNTPWIVNVSVGYSLGWNKD